METAARLRRGAFPLFAYLNVSGRAARTEEKPLFLAFPALCSTVDTDRHCIKDGMKIEPTCGTGNFLDAILKKKLTKIRNIYLVSSNYARKISVFKEIF